MYITQNIAVRIKLTAKSKNISMKKLLSNCDLNVNAVSEFSKGKQLSCISLAKIADYLDCSVDYLLGRTEQEKIAPIVNNENDKQGNINYSISQNNNNGDNVIGNQTKHIEQSKQPNEPEHQDEMTSELTKRFNDLSFDKKLDVFNYMKKLSE